MQSVCEAVMRCVKFDDRCGQALRALDFAISDDGEVATLVGEMQIEIVRPAHCDRLIVVISLPRGEDLNFAMPCAELLEVAGIAEDETA
jgi:hypothetical protein